MALLEIGMALISEPRLLLLDEPTCGMSPAETERAVDKIRELARTIDIIIIEHDMEVVFGIADDITVMAQGAILASGSRRISQPTSGCARPISAARRRGLCRGGAMLSSVNVSRPSSASCTSCRASTFDVAAANGRAARPQRRGQDVTTLRAIWALAAQRAA